MFEIGVSWCQKLCGVQVRKPSDKAKAKESDLAAGRQNCEFQRFASCDITCDHVLPWKYERVQKVKAAKCLCTGRRKWGKETSPEDAWGVLADSQDLIDFLSEDYFVLSTSFHIFPHLSISFHLELNARLRMGSFCRRLLFLEGFRTRPWVGNSMSWVRCFHESFLQALIFLAEHGEACLNVFPSSCSVPNGRFYYLLVGHLFFFWSVVWNIFLFFHVLGIIIPID